MKDSQQNETLQYFRSHAQDWQSKAASGSEQEVNVIQQRNDYALHVIGARGATRSALDVGCGTGDLTCAIARMGIDATGVDFAPEMIEAARTKASNERLGKASFHCSSIFDFNFSDKTFDAISANGFIEYISLADLGRFLDMAHGALNQGGSLILGSRNRLYNLFSMNAFTLQEVEAQCAAALLRETAALADGRDLMALADTETAPLPLPGVTHPGTGIEVSTRHQYTPLQLVKLLKAKGFTVKHAYPIHIHAVSPSFKTANPGIHAGISNLLQGYGHEHMSLIPLASSFMLHAQKDGK